MRRWRGAAPEMCDRIAGLESRLTFHLRFPGGCGWWVTGSAGPSRSIFSTALRISQATLTSSRIAMACKASSCRMGSVTVTRLISSPMARLMDGYASNCSQLLNFTASIQPQPRLLVPACPDRSDIDTIVIATPWE
jgi:hypothetical protein